MELIELSLSQIRCDDKAKPRAKLDGFTIKEYSERCRRERPSHP